MNQKVAKHIKEKNVIIIKEKHKIEYVLELGTLQRNWLLFSYQVYLLFHVTKHHYLQNTFPPKFHLC